MPEHKRYCSKCGSQVGRARDGRPGRTSGFCAKCGGGYDFNPKLAAGDLVGGQYEVLGCLAHGGLGWIYLAKDKNVSGRWVALKGLAGHRRTRTRMAAAIAERQFLAEVEHPNVVKIYNFVRHLRRRLHRDGFGGGEFAQADQLEARRRAARALEHTLACAA